MIHICNARLRLLLNNYIFCLPILPFHPHVYTLATNAYITFKVSNYSAQRQNILQYVHA